jgi:hypothetical protein
MCASHRLMLPYSSSSVAAQEDKGFSTPEGIVL